MPDIVSRINKAILRTEADGREAARILIGNAEAIELEAALHRRGRMWRGMFGAVKFPLDVEHGELFGIPVERVDQPSLLGVIAEGFEA